MSTYECPACGSLTFPEPAWTEKGGDSHEICTTCGLQVGYDDAEFIDRRIDDPIRRAFYRGWVAGWRKWRRTSPG